MCYDVLETQEHVSSHMCRCLKVIVILCKLVVHVQ